MSTYNYTVKLVVSPANGAGEVPSDIEKQKVAEFVRKVENLDDNFGIGKTFVTMTLIP
jgi:hypothetical protein